jgi:hypothetical protein
MQMAEYVGMTVNERLVLSGMNFCFDEAAKARDRNKMIQILVALELAPAGAAEMVDTIFADPARYGV